jgi:hypothetical protein
MHTHSASSLFRLVVGLPVGLLVLSLTAPGSNAQTAAPASAPAAQAESAVDPASVQALKDMGLHLQTLKRFRVTTELSGERVLADGQKLQHGARATMDVARPDRLRATMRSPRSERVLFFDGRMATLYSPAQKAYASVELKDTLEGLVEKLESRFGIEVPLSDLFVWGTPAAPLGKIDSAMNAGQDFIGNDLCDHYAFRQGNVDWQIWITAGPRPLPRKVVITDRSDEARPQSVSLITWNLNPDFTDAVFRFVPPKGATRAQIVAPKTK